MSGYSKRRHSKWDNKDSETFHEDLHDRDPSRRPRESFSPGRGSRRHDNRSKESTMALAREGNCSRISPEQDDRRSRLSSRSPRKGWSRSHRISRSRSRSQSPAHNFRREPAVSDRSRNRSGASGQICRDFAAGRCRRGHSCSFLHQEAQLYDGRRPLGCSPSDDWDGRRRRTGSSKFSPDNINDSDVRTEKSAHICNDYLKGRCRRGDACRFVHHDSAAGVFEKVTDEEVYSNRDRENRSRDVRDRSRDIYPNHDRKSRDTYPDHDHRSRDTYHDQDHRSRDNYPDHGRGSRETYPDIDHGSRDRYSGHDHGRKRMYTDRNYENDPQRRGEIQCKFFAAGNCRNGNHCRFSHQAQEVISPERSRDDKCDTDRNFEGSLGWDGPRWGDATNISAIPTVPGWEGNKSENKEVVTVSIQSDERGLNHKVEADKVWDGPSWTDASVPIVQEVHGNSEIKEVTKDLTGARLSDDSWSHDMLMKPTWDLPATSIDRSEIQENEDPLKWKTESNVPLMDHSTPRGVDIFSGEMEISPRDIKQQTIFNSTAQTPSISNIAFAANLQSTAGETSFEQHCHTGLLGEQNPSYKDNKPISYHGARRDVFVDNNGSSIFQNEAITVPHEQGIFQSYENANVHPIPNMTPSRQSQMPVLLHAPQGEGMQELTHIPPSLDDKVTAEPHTISLSLSAPTPGCTDHSTVSNEQLAQLSHLTASLTQLLESRQQLSQLSSSVSNHGMPNLPDLEAPRPLVSGASVELNQAPVVLKQSDLSSNSIEQKNAINEGYNLNLPENHKPLIRNFPDLEAPRPLVSGTNINLNQAPVVSTQYELSSNSIEQKNAINETSNEGFNLNFPEHHRPSKDEENGKNTGLKAADNGPFQNVGSDDGADDSKKMKDIKGVRPFKFALADFVKELLKPSWKDGQVNKEAYKIIVKKVVDKVMETLGPQVPQTKEKIDLYLSCSKPKIEKLVQAYVDKHKKG